MEWTKIPTTLITKRFTDYELASIVKFQLVWAINEEQPDKQTCLRYMTSKQYETAMTYLDSVSATVGDEVSSVIKKRNAEKIRYNKNKDLSKILQADSKQTADSLSEQIRLDKIREDNIPPVSKDTAPQRVTRFQKPTLEEVKAYCQERNNFVDAEKWFDYYTANGWKVGKNSMKDWKATIRTWERNNPVVVGGTKTLTKAQEIEEHNLKHIKELFERRA